MGKLLYLRFRSMGKLYFVVPLALWGVLPLLCWLSYEQMEGAATGLFGAAEYVEQMGALFAVWWPCLSLKEEVEGAGSELLFVHMGQRGRRSWCDVSTLVWYLLHFWTVGGLLLLVDGRLGVYLVKTTMQIVFMWGLCYFLIAVLRSTSIPLMIAVGYGIAGQMFEEPAKGRWTVFSTAYDVNWELVVHKYLWVFGIGIVLCVLGRLFIQKWRK